MALIELKNIDVTFKQKGQVSHAVKNVSLQINKGDIYGVVGYSGAGKSTLVRVINRLQEPSKGQVIVDGKDMLKLSHSQLRQERKNIGIIFQHFNLMNERTIADNVAYPLAFSGISKSEKQAKVNKLLELVGLSDKHNYYPSQLSGGQKQRVAIARALASDPKILISDEATSALDPKTTQSILKLLKRLNQELDLTVVLITHEMDAVKSICNKVAVMDYGKIVESGDLLKVFSRPENQLTKDFIATTTQVKPALERLSQQSELLHLSDNQKVVSLKYIGSSTDTPIIIDLFKKFDVTASIMFGNVEFIQDTPLGNLIVNMSGTSENLAAAKQFLADHDVIYEEIDLNQIAKEVKEAKDNE